MEEKHEELLQAQVSQQEETKLMIEEDKMVMVKKGILLIVDVFSPLLPFIIVYGILMTCLQICSVLNLHHTLTQFLTLMNHCILSLIPFALLQTIAKKFQTSEILAIAVGLSMTISAYYPGLSQINHYNGQIIPAVFVGLFLVFLEKTLKKYIQSTFVPMLCWAIAIIVVQMLLGPISSDINKGLAMMLSWCFTSEARFIVAPCLCYLSYYFLKKQWLALFIPFDLLMISEFGYTYLWPIVAISQFAFFAVSYFQRDERKLKDFVYISKPVNLEDKTFISYALISGSVASIFASYFCVRSYAIGLSGIVGVLSMEIGWHEVIYLLALFMALLIPYYIITSPAERKKFYQKVSLRFKKKNKSEKIDLPESNEGVLDNTESDEQTFQDVETSQSTNIEIDDAKDCIDETELKKEDENV